MKRIDDIVIGERVRKNMGDIESLAASIKRHGLLHPVVVKNDGTLIAGHRRLEAAKRLGWKEIPVTMIEVDDLLSAERDENEERKSFTPTEAVAIGLLIEEQHRAKIEATKHSLSVQAGRIARGTFVVNKNEGRIPPNGPSHAAAARAVGMGSSSYFRARAVVAAADAEPEKFGDLPETMDDTGNVSGAHREMERRKNNSQDAQPVHGKKARHAALGRTPRLKPNREIQRALVQLDGVCTCLEAINAADLQSEKTPEWAIALKAIASRITRFARGIHG